MGVPIVVLTVEQRELMSRLRSRVARKLDDSTPVKVDPRHLPGDPVALRGVPMLVSGGVGGVIPGTRPGDSARNLERDDRHIAKYRGRRRPHLAE